MDAAVKVLRHPPPINSKGFSEVFTGRAAKVGILGGVIPRVRWARSGGSVSPVTWDQGGLNPIAWFGAGGRVPVAHFCIYDSKRDVTVDAKVCYRSGQVDSEEPLSSGMLVAVSIGFRSGGPTSIY